jgi:hypothetical protein
VVFVFVLMATNFIQAVNALISMSVCMSFVDRVRCAITSLEAMSVVVLWTQLETLMSKDVKRLTDVVL